LDLLSFGSPDAASVDAMAEHLIASGCTLVTQPGEARHRGGGYGFGFFDIDGRTVEISATSPVC
jgi:predicted lactoylglutathione lyase